MAYVARGRALLDCCAHTPRTALAYLSYGNCVPLASGAIRIAWLNSANYRRLSHQNARVRLIAGSFSLECSRILTDKNCSRAFIANRTSLQKAISACGRSFASSVSAAAESAAATTNLGKESANNGKSNRCADDELPRWVGYWLLSSAALVFGIVVLGGLTRLTESGLSITEWKPVTGTLPPMSEADWIEEFEKYKESPEFKLLNSNMTLNEFKFIFFFEWAHRLWARVIGLYFILPALYLIGTHRVNRKMRGHLIGVSFLLSLQGFIGWWMVKSGLSKSIEINKEHPRVSHYRLATHLCAAFLLYFGMLWAGLEGVRDSRILRAKDLSKVKAEFGKLKIPPVKNMRPFVWALGLLVFTTAMSGALVAGLDAGLIYNEFPSMGNNRWIPPYKELFDPFYCKKEDKSDFYWRNMFENPVTVQLTHRILATSSFTAMTLICGYSLLRYKGVFPKLVNRGFYEVSGFVSLQALLGYFTLVYMVPIPVAVTHQAGALATLTVIMVLAHRMTVPKILRANSAILHGIKSAGTHSSRAVQPHLRPGAVPGNVRRFCLCSSRFCGVAAIAPAAQAIRYPFATYPDGVRSFTSTSLVLHGDYPTVDKNNAVRITFVAPNGERRTVTAPVGVSILDVAHQNDIDIEGACEGSCACSTCHVIVDPEYFEKLEEPSDEENDMLDLAFGLQETSRLGCQVVLDKDLDGITVHLPTATRNMRVDNPVVRSRI